MPIPEKYNFFLILSALFISLCILIILFNISIEHIPSPRKPSFSPDGKYIIFGNAGHGKYRGIYCIKKDGTSLKRLVTSPAGSIDLDPVYSPDGSKIAFVRIHSYNSSSKLYLANVDGFDEIQLTNGDFFDQNPVFSADGQRIYFLRSGPPFRNDTVPPTPTYTIYSIGTDGSSLQKETSEDFSLLRGFSISPDNQTLLVSAIKRSSESTFWQIYAFNHSKGEKLIKPDIFNGATSVVIHEPSYSPDGTSIIFFTTFKNSASSNFTKAIYIIDLETGLTHLVTNIDSFEVHSPSFSPDGKEIIFGSGGPYESYKLWIMNSDGSNLHEIKIKL